MAKFYRNTDEKNKGPLNNIIVGLSLGMADEIRASLAKVYRKAHEKKKGPRNGRFVGLSSGMAHEMAVSSAFLHYGRRNLNFVPRVFFISSVNVLFLVVSLEPASCSCIYACVAGFWKLLFSKIDER